VSALALPAFHVPPIMLPLHHAGIFLSGPSVCSSAPCGAQLHHLSRLYQLDAVSTVRIPGKP